jgi:hypothetical protein
MHSRFEFVLERGTKGRLAIIMAKRDDFEQEMAQKVLSTGSSLLMAINRSNALIRRSEGRCLHLSRGKEFRSMGCWRTTPKVRRDEGDEYGWLIS